MSDGEFTSAVAAGLLVCVALVFTGVCIGVSGMRDEAIQRGFAEYNPQTGAWRWKEADSTTAGESK